MLKKPGSSGLHSREVKSHINTAAIPQLHPTNGAVSDCVSLSFLYVYISFRLKHVLLGDLVSAGW